MTASPRAAELALAAAQAAADKLARNIVVIDVSERLVITDCFVITSAENERQVKAAVDEIEERLRRLGAKPVRREGEREGRWVLLDFIDIVVHVQCGEEWAYYSLERLWKDCPTIPFVDRDAARAATTPTPTPTPTGGMADAPAPAPAPAPASTAGGAMTAGG